MPVAAMLVQKAWLACAEPLAFMAHVVNVELPCVFEAVKPVSAPVARVVVGQVVLKVPDALSGPPVVANTVSKLVKLEELVGVPDGNVEPVEAQTSPPFAAEYVQT